MLKVRGLVVDEIVDCNEVGLQNSNFYADLPLKRSATLNTWFEPLQLGAHEAFSGIGWQLQAHCRVAKRWKLHYVGL